MSNQIKTKEINELAFPEITKLELDKSFKQIAQVMPEHHGMLEVIKDSLPSIQRSTSLFMKTQSQYMDNMLTVSHNTPLRNLRQILAEMNQTREAIKEALFKLKKKDIEIRQKQKKISLSEDALDIEMLQVEILELQSQIDTTNGYISGAIRKLTNYTEQYNSLSEKFGVKDFNEEDFEKEEEKYHIMKAFEQALNAARAHNGFIDEGNQIYFSQIGINGTHAQFELSQYLRAENEILQAGKAPTHEMQIQFLEKMAEHFAGSAEKYAESKGMKPMTQTALIQKGDDRLLLAQESEE